MICPGCCEDFEGLACGCSISGVNGCSWDCVRIVRMAVKSDVQKTLRVERGAMPAESLDEIAAIDGVLADVASW